LQSKKQLKKAIHFSTLIEFVVINFIFTYKFDYKKFILYFPNLFYCITIELMTSSGALFNGYDHRKHGYKFSERSGELLGRVENCYVQTVRNINHGTN
jgi:hypothetical protein